MNSNKNNNNNKKEKVYTTMLKRKSVRDFDPEDDDGAGDEGATANIDSDATGDSDSAPEQLSTGREHYQAVGKSRLRKNADQAQAQASSLLDAKKYGGTTVSRATALRNEDDDLDPFAPGPEEEDEDPFATRPAKLGGGLSDEEDYDAGIDGLNGDVDEDESELDSDEAFEDGDAEHFKSKGFVFRGSGKKLDRMPQSSGDEMDEEHDGSNVSAQESVSDSEEVSHMDTDEEKGVSNALDDSDDGIDDDEGESEGEEDDQGDESDDDVSSNNIPNNANGTTDRDKVRALLSSDSAAVAKSLSQAVLADSTKGRAVKQQYRMFDRLLDARIKLQKVMAASNELDTASIQASSAETAVTNAEAAALNLFNTITSIRRTIISSSSSSSDSKSKKRKSETPATHPTSSSDLWGELNTLEQDTLPTHRRTLDKWSSRTRTAGPAHGASSKLVPVRQDANLTSVLDMYLSSESDKLVAQSTTAPSRPQLKSVSDITANDSTTDNGLRPHFNDTLFYQSLLRDLVASKSLSQSHLAANSNSPLSAVAPPLKLHPSGLASADARGKQINRRASKGREVRYTVHEKLENFMAAKLPSFVTDGAVSTGGGRTVGIGEAAWSEDAAREFFASLMGGSSVLREDEDTDVPMDDGDTDLNEEAALRLFR